MEICNIEYINIIYNIYRMFCYNCNVLSNYDSNNVHKRKWKENQSMPLKKVNKRQKWSNKRGKEK